MNQNSYYAKQCKQVEANLQRVIVAKQKELQFFNALVESPEFAFIPPAKVLRWVQMPFTRLMDEFESLKLVVGARVSQREQENAARRVDQPVAVNS